VCGFRGEGWVGDVISRIRLIWRAVTTEIVSLERLV
jgi:hypothetical protein